MTNPHASDVFPDLSDPPIVLAESLIPNYALGRALEFIGRGRDRQGEARVKALLQASYHLNRYMQMEARRAGIVIQWNPTTNEHSLVTENK